MVEINKIKRLNEFSVFIDLVKNDDRSNIGRKFYVEKNGKRKTYTMNEITDCFEKCVKKSIQNCPLVTKVSKQMAIINSAATIWVEEDNNKCLLFLRKFFGNLWFAITHCGFNKDKVLTDIAAHKTSGRTDLTIDTMNVQDVDGNTALHRLIKDNKNPKKLYRDIKELIENGADLSLKNKLGQTALDLCFAISFPLADDTRLRALLLNVKPEMLLDAVCRNYRGTLTIGLKEELAKIVKLRLKSPVTVINALQHEEAKRDFFMVFFKTAYLQHKPMGGGKTAFDFSIDETIADESGNNMLHYAAKYLTAKSDVEKCVSSRDKIENWKVRNEKGKLPVDLVEDPAIIEYLNSLD